MREFSVSVGGKAFSATDQQALIDFIPPGEIIKGCLKGVCRVCRCTLISGQVQENGKVVSNPSANFLPCVSRGISDIEIKPSLNIFQSAKISNKTLLSENILKIVLDVRKAFYNSKSIINIKHPHMQDTRCYSIVSLGEKDYSSVCIHVKLRKNGVFSNLFAELSVGDNLHFMIVNPILPVYDDPISTINVVSGGSGMGAALTRAQDLALRHKTKKINIFAINRSSLSEYHQNCIETFQYSIKCELNIKNIFYLTWVDKNFSIEDHIHESCLNIGVGSNVITEKLQNLPLCEIQSFG